MVDMLVCTIYPSLCNCAIDLLCCYIFVHVQLADKVKKAVECAMTYLLYHPDDEVMLNNIRHYKEVEGIKDEDFVPRQVRGKYSGGYSLYTAMLCDAGYLS